MNKLLLCVVIMVMAAIVVSGIHCIETKELHSTTPQLDHARYEIATPGP